MTRKIVKDPAASIRAKLLALAKQHSDDFGRVLTRYATLGRPRVLDLGCGTGTLLAHLADVIMSGVGVDISPVMIKRARRRMLADAAIEFTVADAAEYCAARPSRFDLILLVGALDHVPDQDAALAAVVHALDPFGRALVISPHRWHPFFLLQRLLHDGRDVPRARHSSLARLRRLAARHGLAPSRVRALPYAAWPELSPALCWVARHLPQIGHGNALTGMIGGDFAAEFSRAPQPSSRANLSDCGLRPAC